MQFVVETSGRKKQCDGKSFPPLGREAATFVARGSGECLSYPSRSGRSPAAKRIFVHLGLNIKCLAMVIFNNMLLGNVK